MLSTTPFKVLTALGLVSTVVSAAAVESRQQGNSDDAVLFSPSNGTSVAAGQSINFDYLCDDSETTTIDVALIRYEVIGQGIFLERGDSGTFLDQNFNLPDDIPLGNYVIGIHESDRVTFNRRYDYDITHAANDTANAFEGTIHHEVIARQPARRDLQSRQENTPSARSDASVILSPRNNSRTEQGTAFRLYYLADRDDEDINVVDVAFIAYYRVLNGSQTQSTADGRRVTTSITLPSDIPPGRYLIGVDEHENDDDDDTDLYDFDRFFGTSENRTEQNDPIIIEVTASLNNSSGVAPPASSGAPSASASGNGSPTSSPLPSNTSAGSGAASPTGAAARSIGTPSAVMGLLGVLFAQLLL